MLLSQKINKTFNNPHRSMWKVSFHDSITNRVVCEREFDDKKKLLKYVHDALFDAVDINDKISITVLNNGGRF